MDTEIDTAVQELDPATDDQAYETVDDAVDALAEKFDAQQDPNALEPDPEPSEDEQQEAELDAVEVQIGDKTYKLPKSFEEQFVPKAEFTRKTMEAAEIRKHGEAQFQAAQLVARHASELSQFDAQVLVRQQTLAQIQQQLPQLYQEDPTRANSLAIQAMAIQNEIGQLGAQRQNLAFQLNHAEQQEIFRQQAEAVKALSKSSWFNEPTREAISNYVREKGVDDNTAARVTHPAMIEMAYKAMMYDKGQQAKQQAQQSLKVTPKVVRPGVAQGKAVNLDLARANLRKTGSVDAAIELELLKSGRK